jgi:hypothetical protein
VPPDATKIYNETNAETVAAHAIEVSVCGGLFRQDR